MSSPPDPMRIPLMPCDGDLPGGSRFDIEETALPLPAMVVIVPAEDTRRMTVG